MESPITIDFETAAIEARPKYPPEPVGVSILDGRECKYWAWGHPTKNNCTKAQAKERLAGAYRSGRPLLFHNAKFDMEVAEKHFGLKLPPWDKFHDTLFDLFLHNPHAKSLSLKPAAAELLGMPPEERDAVNEWLCSHGIIKRPDQKDAGAYICKAPGDLVGEYAKGDVIRTEKLWRKVHPLVLKAGMGEAYDRERRLLPVLLENEREGMRVDVTPLRKDIKLYEAALARVDEWLRKRLKSPELNLDADADVAKVLEALDLVTEWELTPTGRKSVSKKFLTPDKFRDPKVASALGYRNRLTTVLSMSMRPWLEQAEAGNGYITTQWNSVRQSHGNDGFAGARTGRLSCSRFMNITKDFEDKDDGYVHPKFLRGLPRLPLVRRYILPDEGDAFGHRDYNQQELRILGHFEDGALCRAYNEDPKLDIHSYVQRLIKEILGLDLQRRYVKNMNFGKVYGMGSGALAERLGCTVEEARRFFAAHSKALPGVKDLENDIKWRAREGKPVRTWGGRLYYCEEPKLIKGRMWDFSYKLLNYIVQGSAADCTKEALIRYAGAKKRARFLVTVHDEINFSAPKKAMREEMRILKDVMSSIEFDVPMLSDGKAGPNWGSLTKWED